MRIRRRPQPSSLQPSDPSTSTAPPTPQNAARNQECLHGGEEEGKLHLRHADADLGQKSGVARRLALPLPQDNAAVDGVKSSRHGARQGAADDIRRSLVNGGHGGPEPKGNVTCNGGGGKAEPAAKEDGPVSNCVAAAAAAIAAVKDEKNGGSGDGGGGAKKRRGPAVLMEGSRCSRVNGRGWRCSQPTLVGYSLCEHHLGKGRMRSVAGGGRGAAGQGQLGRTEHLPRIPAPAKAEEPGLRPC